MLDGVFQVCGYTHVGLLNIRTGSLAYGAAGCVAGRAVSSMSEVVVGPCGTTLAAFVGRLLVRGGACGPPLTSGMQGAMGCSGELGGVPPPTPPGKFYKHVCQGVLLLGVAPLQNVLHGLTLVQFFIRIVQILSSSISAAEILFARSACE